MPARAQVDDITPAEHAACDGDVAKFCSDAYPDPQKVLGCMKENRGNLTPICRKTFDAGLRKRHLPL